MVWQEFCRGTDSDSKFSASHVFTMNSNGTCNKTESKSAIMLKTALKPD